MEIKKRYYQFKPFSAFLTAALTLACLTFSFAWADPGAAHDRRPITFTEDPERPVQTPPPVLAWRHNTTKAAAIEKVKNALERHGYARYVRWNGDEMSSRIVRFFVKVIDARGRVTDEAIILERCRGAAAGAVISRCRELLSRSFPGGEIL